jgi:putative membrane protein insertion efficiency factor
MIAARKLRPEELRRRFSGVLRSLACLPFRLWKLMFSPLLGERCRFYPSCSEYAEQAVMEHGVLYGFLLAAARVLRCQPFAQGGFDPVPARSQNCCGSPGDDIFSKRQTAARPCRNRPGNQ